MTQLHERILPVARSALNRTPWRWWPALLLALLMGMASAPAGAADPLVRFVTSEGTFTLQLHPRQAPATVANFLQYVRDGFYDGTIFHRVIRNFMIQGGGFDRNYTQKQTRPAIPHEGRQAQAAGLSNVRGSVAMARTSDPDSATAQFFINVVDNARLDPTPIPPGDPVPEFTYQGRSYRNVPRADLEHSPQLAGYTVFGTVVDGMDTVDRIRDLPTGAGGPFASDAPLAMAVIQSATIISNPQEKQP